MKKPKKKVITLTILGILIITLLGVGLYESKHNIRVRLLSSIFHVSESTLKDPGYLLYDIDVMDLCRNYLNGETQISGKAGFDHMKKVKSSIYMQMEGERSFAKKQSVKRMQMDLLWIPAGRLNMYGDKETIYLDAPLIGENVGWTFPTGINLFMKAPDLTSDIDREWFHDHAADIVRLMSHIPVEKTGKVITCDDGTKAEGVRVVIPEGEGGFIWELFGMEAPKYDVEFITYLTKDNHTRRIEMDLSKVVEGVSVVLEGKHLGTSHMTWELPDNEKFTATMHRSTAHKNEISCKMNYYTNTDKSYEVTDVITWKNKDKSFDIKLSKIKITSEDKTLAEGFFKGNIKMLDTEPDIYGDKEAYLKQLPVLDWKQIREDSEGFINQVLEKTAFAP